MYAYEVDKGRGPTLEFQTAQDVFLPTHTSQLLIAGAQQSIRSRGRLLDLGCGIGVCGLVLARLGICELPVYLCDVSERATGVAQANARALQIPAVIRSGSLFDPWEGERFDVIVEDVSGVCEEIARISPWFPEGVPCQSGVDGTALVAQVLEQSPRYLKPGGLLLFPVLSLSNGDRILEVAHAHFSEVSLVAKQSWFLPEELLRSFDRLKPLLEAGRIRLEQRFGCWLWSTQIHRASLPRNPQP